VTGLESRPALLLLPAAAGGLFKKKTGDFFPSWSRVLQLKNICIGIFCFFLVHDSDNQDTDVGQFF
jgi:hypothetical protein